MVFSETQTVTPYRHLRITTIATFIPAFALLLPTGVVTARPLPAIGLVPMAMSAVLSAATLMSKRKDFPETPYADAAVVLALLVVMIPSWIFLAQAWNLDRNTIMLASYGITPMIVNCVIHAYLSITKIHYLLQPRTCPNCNHTISPRWGQQRYVSLPHDGDDQDFSQRPGQQQEQTTSFGGARGVIVKKETFPRFVHMQGDEDARESSEFQTSGFNTPRQSAETLGSEARRSGEESLV